MRHSYGRSRGPIGRKSMVVAAALVLAVVGSAPAASAALTDPDPSQNPCIANSTFSLSTSRSSVIWGQPIVLTAAITPASGCLINSSNTSVHFVDPQTGVNYSEPFTLGQANRLIPPGTGRYDLVVLNSAQLYHVASVGVQLSGFPMVGGHPYARILPNIPDEAVTFEQIVQQDNARVSIPGDVALDLSGMDHIPVHSGVQIIGERDAAHPHGPRLYTGTFPDRLLDVGDDGRESTGQQRIADNVRITGLVLDGGEPADPCASAGDGVPSSDAVFVYASQGVQIDHNEMFHWRGAGVDVRDNDDDRITPTGNTAGVWVLGNYFHDNMHPTSCDNFSGGGLGLGYGVVASSGGFPYIQGNLFNNNRHAIAASGDHGSGYVATGNLFLSPGINKERLDGLQIYLNHQMDMHGTDTCNGETYSCGQGGLYVEVANNTVVGNISPDPSATFDAPAFKLRGKPANVLAGTDAQHPVIPNVTPGIGVNVHDNVFNAPQSLVLVQNDPSFGLNVGPGNTFMTLGGPDQQAFERAFWTPSSTGPFCDFDGDGTGDPFRNTAGTFWYYSSRLTRWTYLTTNNVPGSLSLGDTNGDGLCDVSNASGVVYRTPAPFESFPLTTTMPDLRNLTQSAAEDAVAAVGLRLDVAQVRSFSPVGAFISQSVAAGSGIQAGSLVVLTLSAGGLAVVPNVIGLDADSASAAIQGAGLWPQRGQDMPLTSPDQDGIVLTQYPQAGTVVDQGSSVGFAAGLYSPKGCYVACPGR